MNWTWSEYFPWVYSNKTSDWIWVKEYPWIYSASANDWSYFQRCGSDGFWEFRNAAEDLTFVNNEPNIETTTQDALNGTGMDYLEGFLTGDTTRLSDSLHENVVVRGPSGAGFRTSTKTDLIGMAEGNSDEIGDNRVTVCLLDVVQDTAIMRVDGPDWYEQCQVALIAGEWKILNAFYDGWNTATGNGESSFTSEDVQAKITSERTALIEAGMNYVEGFFTGDLDRIRTSVHEDLVKRRSYNNSIGYTEMTRATLLSYAAKNSAAVGATAINVIVIDVVQDTALIRVDSPNFYDYCQLFKMNGTWQIVNVLWDTWD